MSGKNPYSSPSYCSTESKIDSSHEQLKHLSERVAAAEEYVRQHAKEALHAGHHKEQELGQAIKRSSEKAHHFIDNHPLASAGIAFGAGILLTLMLGRR